MKEGAITHEEVNAAIAAAPKTLLFGWQNRARDGLRIGDQSLRRLHIAHDQVRFFYSSLRQLPEFFFEALLASNITVTLVMDRGLLCFKDVRNHQAIHIGRARRTIYLPERILAEVYHNGYDYWSLTQILIAEGWKLLDYALLATLAEAGLRRQLTHRTAMGYSAFRRILKEKNRHRSAYESPARREQQERSGLKLPINESEEFIEIYEGPFLKLMRPGQKGEPVSADDLAKQLYDEYQEELWARRKVEELAEELQFPTLFLLDRDVVHPLARQQAEKAGQDPAPRTMDEARHDFGDELRFGRGREGASERLVQAALRFGPEGVEGLLREICAALFTSGRADQDLEERALRLLAPLSSHPIDLHVYLERGLALVRLGEVLRFFGQVRSGERRLHLEDLDWIRALVVGLAATKARAGDSTQAQVIGAIHKVEELFAQLKVLLAREAGRVLGRTVAADEIEPPVVLEEIARETRSAVNTVVQALDLPANYQKNVLEQFGDRPETPPDSREAKPGGIINRVSRILKLLPPRLHSCTSGSATALRRPLREFEQLRARFPTDPEQLGLLAMVLVRLDRAENYEQLLEEVRALGRDAVGQRLEFKGRATSGRIVDKVAYRPGLLKVIDEEGWEGSQIARRAASLVRELAGEEVLEPLREEAKASGRD